MYPDSNQNPEGVVLEANPDTGDVTARSASGGAPLHEPGRFITPIIWVIIVLAFAIPMVLSAITLMLEFLSPGPASPKVEASMILIFFSTSAGFLAGLVVPSPVGR